MVCVVLCAMCCAACVVWYMDEEGDEGREALVLMFLCGCLPERPGEPLHVAAVVVAAAVATAANFFVIPDLR